MDLFLTLLGLAIVFWAINGVPLIKINRKCVHREVNPDWSHGASASKPSSQIGAVDARVNHRYGSGYTPVRRSGGYHSASVDVRQMKPPPGGGGVVRPQNIAKPSEANVEPPKGGSGQAKINLQKEKE